MITKIISTKTKPNGHRRLIAIGVIVALLLAILPGIVAADKPPQIPAWYNGEIVYFTVVSENVIDIDHPGIHKAAATLYAFGVPGNTLQLDVFDSVPGVPGYNPWWHVIHVTPTDDRDLGANPYTSEAEILAAADANDVVLEDTGFHFLCQVLP